MKKLTTEDWIKRAKESHGTKYDYSRAKYVGSQDKIEIGCPEHGFFWQLAYSHLDCGSTSGRGCPECGNKNRKRTVREEYASSFVEKAQAIHGSRYGYERVEYSNCDTKVQIHCRKHGFFWQAPFNHLKGAGCKTCSTTKRADEAIRQAAIAFPKTAREKHNGIYTYDESVYVNSRTKIEISCPAHGSFWQTPANHLSGHGCPTCSNQDMTTSRFIERSKKEHGSRYDYSKVKYINAVKKVCIICSVHGEFMQSPQYHMRGMGCRQCAADLTSSTGTTEIANWLDNLGFEYRCEVSFDGLTAVTTDYRKFPLRFDFFVESLRVLIEYDGEGHFMPIREWGGKRALRAIQQNDRAKNEWAFEHGYTIVRIPYFDLDRLSEILSAALLYVRPDACIGFNICCNYSALGAGHPA